MQEAVIELYDYQELDELVKDTVRHRWLEHHYENPWGLDNLRSWTKFKDLILYDVEEDRYGTLRLPVYNEDVPDEELYERYKYRLEEAGENPTGYCMDYSTFGFAKETLKKGIDIVEWMNDVRYNWEKACEEDDLCASSEEAMIEQFEINDVKFLENGQEFLGTWEVKSVQV